MKNIEKMLFGLCLLLVAGNITAQVRTDSVREVNTITIKAPLLRSSLLNSPISAAVLNKESLQQHVDGSLLSGVNSVSGVRMEERSPGSYRLSIRGSLLRSPFGIRNIKVYIDDFSLTDAGGNSYLNLIDLTAIESLEIFKGPSASLFGANTGGTVLLNLNNTNPRERIIELGAGSYGSFSQNASLTFGNQQRSLNVKQAYQTSDGFREQSHLDRKYFQLSPSFQIAKNIEIKGLLLYSDIHYQTPGGLTEVQAIAAPRSARPSTATLPGAMEQNAGVYNKTLFTGLSSAFRFNDFWQYRLAVHYVHTNFENPFITNFEIRKERTAGLRTYLTYEPPSSSLPLKFDIGLEGSKTLTDVTNSVNNRGIKAALNSADFLEADQFFAFSKLRLFVAKKLLLEGALSINLYKFAFDSSIPTSLTGSRKLQPELMPSFAMSYNLTTNMALRATVAKGYSPPTLAEIRASDNMINTELQAEYGFNYEAGWRYYDDRWHIDLTAFRFRLQNAIVRRVNNNDTEYFINAGGTRQNGLELQMSYHILPSSVNFLNKIRVNAAYTFSNFRFADYFLNQQQLSGNRLTGTPQHVWSLGASLGLGKKIQFYTQLQHTSSIWLNDQNTALAPSYILMEAKVRHLIVDRPLFRIETSLGAANILNQSYSLGHDLNAVGNRFFNPAAGRNYQLGLKTTF